MSDTGLANAAQGAGFASKSFRRSDFHRSYYAAPGYDGTGVIFKTAKDFVTKDYLGGQSIMGLSKAKVSWSQRFVLQPKLMSPTGASAGYGLYEVVFSVNANRCSASNVPFDWLQAFRMRTEIMTCQPRAMVAIQMTVPQYIVYEKGNLSVKSNFTFHILPTPPNKTNPQTVCPAVVGCRLNLHGNSFQVIKVNQSE